MNALSRIAPATVVVPYSGFTAREFVEMLGVGAFADMRVELVTGELQKMAPANGGHGRSNINIGAKLLAAVAKLNADVAIDLAVRIDELTVRGIDIAVGLKSFPNHSLAEAASVWLAVEIADTTLARDLGIKVSDYARGGIPHYWVVDLNGKAVHVMSGPSDDGYASRTIVRFGEELAVPGTDEVILIP